MILFSVTYEIVTQESADYGDTDSRGYIAEDVSLRDALQYVTETRTNECGGIESISADSSHGRPRWVTVQNSMEYTSGAYESRSIHIPSNVSDSTASRIARLLGAHN